ncbi:hypothetical protein BGP79_08730 [Tersicoccus sp. Bi-70]|nr:hypothetical protein BGP79_08730 [Tersicoccus sp. Bi-70]
MPDDVAASVVAGAAAAGSLDTDAGLDAGLDGEAAAPVVFVAAPAAVSDAGPDAAAPGVVSAGAPHPDRATAAARATPVMVVDRILIMTHPPA